MTVAEMRFIKPEIMSYTSNDIRTIVEANACPTSQSSYNCECFIGCKGHYPVYSDNKCVD